MTTGRETEDRRRNGSLPWNERHSASGTHLAISRWNPLQRYYARIQMNVSHLRITATLSFTKSHHQAYPLHRTTGFPPRSFARRSLPRAMPTVLHSAVRPDRGSSSIELQKLLLCLGAVLAFVVTSFGLVKLVGLLPAWRRAESSEVAAAAKTPSQAYRLAHPHPHLAALDDDNHPLSARDFRLLKARPRDARTGAIRYTKTAPHLHHINAPRAYALRHQHRPFGAPLGPSPLRNVVFAAATHSPQKPRVRRPIQRFRAICALSALPQDTIPPADEADPLWRAADHLHRTADAVVGAHPATRPLHDRVASPLLPASSPWFALSSVAFSTNLKSGPVRGTDIPPPFRLATASVLGPRNNANTNLGARQSFVGTGFTLKESEGIDKLGKENVVCGTKVGVRR
ncbi:hypothetical protein FB451DRAFT_1362815 [Mycena latifolia]|nr:hypothetical protein FB451DRAFT_1362815 [Mycena latifolia]